MKAYELGESPGTPLPVENGEPRSDQTLGTNVGDAGRRAVVLLSRLILEDHLRKPGGLVKCAASWLRTPGIIEEVKDAIQATIKTKELRASLIATLSTEYWDSRSDVWLILDSLDSRSSIAVRQAAFDAMLGRDPRWFIAATIQETQDTQDFAQVKREVMMALAEVARTKGSAIVAAVRSFIAPSNRAEIRRLISDFSTSDAPLKKVAQRLWLTHLWLSFQQFFS